MKHLLAAQQAQVLEQYARSRVVLAFDFDGTLAPIVTRRHAAAMRASTRKLLTQLSQVYPCAVISGRSRADTIQKIGGIALAEVMGNHGLEPGNVGRYAKDVSAMLPVLRKRLQGMVGIEIENKRLSIAVHYRQARDKQKALAAIRAAVALLPVPVRVVSGKQLLNLLPLGAPGKGQALWKLRRRLRVDRAVFVGDDITDEDVFSSGQANLLAVRVGRSKASVAAYFLRNQREIDRLLEQLLKLRRNRSQ
ncbi:MAG TPA: trehalose-phosphatase [Polyangiaceae bacterium]|jgi:trehalose 6-phosphate phosphatase|nr:trehalose-phosphatase [Polyangiaceae bacterium]